MKRYYILDGDKTTVGGIVQKHIGGGSTFSWHGKTQSHIGDKVDCPACKSVGIILAVGARVSFNNNGHIPALNGDLCICKCSPSPTLVHSQTVFLQDTDDGIGDSTMISDTLNSSKKYNLRFQTKNSLGHPIVKTKYMLVDEEGKVYFGETDSQGYTKNIFSDKEKKFSIHILLDDSEGFENG